MKGPVIDIALYKRQLLTGQVQFIVDLFEQAGNRRHHGRIHLFNIVGYGSQTLGIIHRHAQELIQVHQHPFVSMAQRQEAQRGLAPGGGRRFQIFDLTYNVTVRKHHSFGITGGARSVNNGGKITGFYRIFQCLQFFRHLMLATQLNQLIQKLIIAIGFVEHENRFQRFHIGQYRLQFTTQILSFDENHFHLGMVKNVTIILLTNGGINRN